MKTERRVPRVILKLFEIAQTYSGINLKFPSKSYHY